MDPMGYDIIFPILWVTMHRSLCNSASWFPRFTPPRLQGKWCEQTTSPPAMGYNWSPQTSIFHDETLICFTQIKTKKMEHPEIASGSWPYGKWSIKLYTNWNKWTNMVFLRCVYQMGIYKKKVGVLSGFLNIKPKKSPIIVILIFQNRPSSGAWSCCSRTLSKWACHIPHTSTYCGRNPNHQLIGGKYPIMSHCL